MTSRQHGLISRRQAVDLGLTDLEIAHLVRQGSWVRVRRGVFADSELWNSLDEYRGRPLVRVRAAHMCLATAHWFSHDSAALLHGIGLPDPRSSLVHVTRPGGVLGSRTKAGINHHQAWFSLDQMDAVDGLPVLDVARTALDLARQHGLVAGVAGCDHALRSGVSLETLRAAHAAMAYWPGTRDAGAAIDLADPGAENYGASDARCLVHELGIGWPETQFGLSDGGRTVFCDIRVGRHVFELDGHLKYRQAEAGGLARGDAAEVLWQEKKRQDFVCGFKLGMSRITFHDLYDGRSRARARLQREYADTVARFGTSIDDLAPYIVRRIR